MLLYCPCKHTSCYCTVHVNTHYAIVLSMLTHTMLLYCPCKHTPCYCTVHVNTPHAIVLSMFLLCDKMWSFWEEANLCLFFYSLFIYVLPLEIQLSRGEGWDAINQFNTVTFLYLSQANSWISNFICRGFFVFCDFS